jgi:serine/threonine-protein kinase
MYENGTLVCGYEIMERLGSGGLSEDYKARGTDGALVTLKFPSPEMIGDPATYERFLRELKIGQKMQHPAIPHAIAINENKTGPCLIMEYVEGKSLRAILAQRKTLPLKEALDITGQLAEALTYLQTHGVFHRDLKPENVLIDNNGKVHIIDFGIALLQGARRVTWQNLSDVLGTPDYMSPEQIQGKRGDARTDLYALGILFYEMLTGSVPFGGDNALAVMHQHLTVTPAFPAEMQEVIPANIRAIILRCIRKNPKERYQSAEELLNALKNYEKLDTAQFSTGTEKSADKVSGVVTNRQIWIVGICIAVGFVVILGLIIGLSMLAHR